MNDAEIFSKLDDKTRRELFDFLKVSSGDLPETSEIVETLKDSAGLKHALAARSPD